jgi:cysteine-rich repeat protein
VARVGTPLFLPVPNTHIVNQCEDRLITVGNPFSILVPTNKDLVQTAPPVVQSEHGLDHFLCYKVPLPNALPPGFQVDVTDQFQTRRYDLKRITKLCVPVAKDVVPGSPPVRLADGSPVTIEPSPIRNPKDHLVCYKAKRSLRLIAQDGCGPAVPGDTGTAIQPPQPPHQRVFGVFLNNQLGEERMDTKPQRFLGQELCLPSAKNPVCGDGVVEPLAGEQCDDGNTLDGDGCSSTCQIEP